MSRDRPGAPQAPYFDTPSAPQAPYFDTPSAPQAPYFDTKDTKDTKGLCATQPPRFAKASSCPWRAWCAWWFKWTAPSALSRRLAPHLR